MIIGFGNDIQSLDAIADFSTKETYLKRILTPKELEQLATRQKGTKRYIQFIAGRFSAKEAYAKAKGFGIGEHAHWQEIEILNDNVGKPILTVIGESKIDGATNYLVAISHSDNYVLTNVIVEK
ncbi:MAG: holo-ACP synthase [Lactobacillaceae bacterium]|jgi:holo-[acyl-carrier protein] synthase|nr:holo-ACP synthase [Lactobacillaceae bacterium]